MMAALRSPIIDEVAGVTRISRGWVVLAYAHSDGGRSQLGLFSWPGFRLLDGANGALAELMRDDPECAEKIMKAEMELAPENASRSKVRGPSANHNRDVGGKTSKAPSTCSQQHAKHTTKDRHVPLSTLA
jgi:hypothetical protein